MLGKNGFGFDCASLTEINMINKKDREIIFANPIKMISHLKKINTGMYNNVSMMTLDSIEEYDKILSYGTGNRKLLIRIAVDDSHSQFRLNTKFGIKVEDAKELFKHSVGRSESISGVAFHVGSNCKSSISYKKALDDVVRTIDIAKHYGNKLTTVDIGCGLTKDFFLLNETSYIVKDFRTRYPMLTLIGEPGRLMVEDVFDLYVKIIGKSGSKYFINNSIYGDLNCMIFDGKKPIPTFITSTNDDSKRTKRIQLFGATCDSMDVIYNDLEVPETLQVGDCIKFSNMGAYTYSSRSSFNGIPVASVIPRY